MAMILSDVDFSSILWPALVLVLLLPILHIAGHGIYNLYFAPLRIFPGPKSWIVLPLLRHISSVRGTFNADIKRFHDKYGEVIRFSEKNVSFITADAWKDIYGYGHSQMSKEGLTGRGEIVDIITANHDDHTRFRKALAPAFSERALRQQEPLLKEYCDLMVEKLKVFAISHDKIDIAHWYNMTTFDMVGDLSFGQPLNGLRGTGVDVESWIASLFNSIKYVPLFRVAQTYPLFSQLILAMTPQKLRNAHAEHEDRTRELVMGRVNDKSRNARGDFMDSMLRHRGEKEGLSDDELVSNATLLFLAGSETTGTLLSGVTYWLLSTPHALRRVTNEVRSAFQNEDEITFTNATSRLPYMLACLDEALRIYPPVPTGLGRVCPPGQLTRVAGYDLPPKTIVSIPQAAAYRSSTNFYKPDSFLPERWLGPPQPSSLSGDEKANDAAWPFANDNRAVVQPFSAGSRNCIGRNLAYNEMRLILARLLWNFDLELCNESRNWGIGQRAFILWEKDPLWCRLSLREGIAM